ncbi:MAG: signal peptidase II [Waddliaceae bacterium]
MPKQSTRKPWLWVLGLSILLLDILTKAWIFNYFSFFRPAIPIISNLFGVSFSLTYAINYGAAWGLFSNYQTPLFILRIVFILGMACYFFLGKTKKSWSIPLTLILAGAVGNVIDTFLYGHVVDMFHFSFFGYNYPVFNIADSAITIGICWILLFTSNKERDVASI